MGTASSTQTYTRLSGVWLRLAQAAWWVVAGLTLFLFAVAISINYNGVADIGAGLKSNAAGEIVLSPVISDLPAGQAGILEGDILVAVDGLPITPEMRSYQVNFLLRGPIGSPVKVAVRTGNGSVREYTLVRAMGYSNRFQIQLGLPVHFVATYTIAFDLAVMLAFTAVAALLFWRRADDGMALFVSITLVTLGASTAASLNNLAVTLSDWGWAASSFVAFSHACGFSLLYLFPDGQFVPRWTRALVALHAAWAVAQGGPVLCASGFQLVLSALVSGAFNRLVRRAYCTNLSLPARLHSSTAPADQMGGAGHWSVRGGIRGD